MNMINDGGPERIWIESDGGCPYFYHEDELSDVGSPITEYVRADKLRAEIEALREEVERLSRYYKNGIDCFANPCERHSGERTPPFAEFFEKYGGQCLICVVDNNKALQAENERLRAEIKIWEASFEQAASGHATYAEKTEQLLAENERLRKTLKDADNELDWLDEGIDTCDHSVGVCMCSYWNMRRNMKAALSKENKA